MPGISDFSLPSYLAPPTQAQEAQLGMERQQQEFAQAQILQKGFERMQKKVAMAKVMGQAAELQAAGVDPEEARSQALLRSGRGLFDTPEEWNKVSTELEDSISRKRATKAFHEEIQHSLAEKDPETGALPDPQDVLARAWAKWGPEIAGGKSFVPYVNTAMRIGMQKQALSEKGKEFQQREQRIRELREAGLDLGYTQEAGRQERFEEPSANVKLQQKEASERAAEAQAATTEREQARLLSQDKTLIDLRKRREDLQKKIDARASGPSPLEKIAGVVPGASKIGVGEEAFGKQTSKMMLDLEELDGRIQKRENEITKRLKGSAPSSTKPAKGGRIRVKRDDGTTGTIDESLRGLAEKTPGWTILE